MNFVVLVSVSSRSRDFCLFFMVSESVSKKIWYRKKSRNRSRKKIGTEKSLGTGHRNIWSRSRNFSVSKLPGLETFPLDLFKPFVSFSHIYLTISCQNFGVSLCLGIGLVPFPGLLYFLDGIGTGLEKNLVPEKFPELVSEKFSTEKSLGTGLGENLVPKKCPGTGLGQIFGLVTHWSL